MLWKAIIIGPSRLCAKSTSLGYSSNCCRYLWSYGSRMCVESKSKLLVTFRCPCCGNFTCMLNANKLLDTRFHENPRLWWWSSSLLTMHAKIGYISSSFLSFMFCFRFRKAHNMLAMMLDPRCKGLGLVMQYVGKERAFQILGEYDRLILFMFLVCIQVSKPN